MCAWWSKNPLKQFREKLGNDIVRAAPEDLVLYGFDATTFRSAPSLVVLAESVDDIISTVEFARSHGLPIVARGAGSGLSGGSVPVEGGIVLSCERMKSILNIDSYEGIAIVQPGVVTADLQEAVSKYKLFYPPDPSSHTISTIGGNVAENAGGLRCFKYGVTGHYVLGLEYVNADGKICRTGILREKPTEPDLTSLMVGSEGTLGIFTRIALRLIPVPESVLTLSAHFENTMTAFSSIEGIIKNGWVPSVMELMDGKALKSAADFTGTSVPEGVGALVLLELDGDKSEIAELLPKLKSHLLNQALDVEVATDSRERDSLWQLRRNISPSLIRLATGRIHEDVAVPRGNLCKLAGKVAEISEKYGLQIPVYGHAGDGNLHVVILFDSLNPKEKKSATDASADIFKSAIELGGSITGEHGIGCAKKEFLSWQQSEETIDLAKRIKNSLDPFGIFNPGKIFV